VLFAGSFVAIVAAVAGALGYLGWALVGAIVAVVAALGGVALIMIERRNTRLGQPTQPRGLRQ
jgi:predicted small integral membrane protein